MAKKQQKFYVVWKGHNTGVFETWQDCSLQVSGFPGAKFKSFLTRTAAEQAFNGKSGDYIGKNVPESKLTAAERQAIGEPIEKSICVDAACSGSPGRLEYRGVDTSTGKVLFEKGPFYPGTNNVGEFLSLVHAAALLKKHKINKPIYTDSRTALKWLRNKRANTKLQRTAGNKELFELLASAEKWLAENTITNRILKWETEAWGEIPADYGRK